MILRFDLWRYLFSFVILSSNFLRLPLLLFHIGNFFLDLLLIYFRIKVRLLLLGCFDTSLPNDILN